MRDGLVVEGCLVTVVAPAHRYLAASIPARGERLETAVAAEGQIVAPAFLTEHRCLDSCRPSQNRVDRKQ